MGVVKHDVNTSAGKSGFWGSISFAPQAASRMPSSKLLSPPCLPASHLAASYTSMQKWALLEVLPYLALCLDELASTRSKLAWETFKQQAQ